MRREIVALRKMVADGPAAHEGVALKLNTTLPVTSQEEIADVEQEIKEGGKKKVMVCWRTIYLTTTYKNEFTIFTTIHIFKYFYRKNNCQL